METIYDQGRKAFLIKDGDEEQASVPFPFSDKDHQGQDLQMADVADYKFATYYKKDVRELEYCIVNVNTGAGGGAPQRVGWMIPFATLTTEDETILNQQHLNQYIFYAYCHLLEKQEIMEQLADGNELGDIIVVPKAVNLEPWTRIATPQDENQSDKRQYQIPVVEELGQDDGHDVALGLELGKDGHRRAPARVLEIDGIHEVHGYAHCIGDHK